MTGSTFYVTCLESGAIHIWVPKWIGQPKVFGKESSGIIRKCLESVPIEDRILSGKNLANYCKHMSSVVDDHDIAIATFTIKKDSVSTTGNMRNPKSIATAIRSASERIVKFLREQP